LAIPGDCCSLRQNIKRTERARRLARSVTKGDVEQQLLQMAEEYDRLVVDLEKGAIEIRKPEQMPQRQQQQAD
jgi:hypothetical protein